MQLVMLGYFYKIKITESTLATSEPQLLGGSEVVDSGGSIGYGGQL